MCFVVCVPGVRQFWRCGVCSHANHSGAGQWCRGEVHVQYGCVKKLCRAAVRRWSMSAHGRPYTEARRVVKPSVLTQVYSWANGM
jgi:hypothetical protein